MRGRLESNTCEISVDKDMNLNTTVSNKTDQFNMNKPFDVETKEESIVSGLSYPVYWFKNATRSKNGIWMREAQDVDVGNHYYNKNNMEITLGIQCKVGENVTDILRTKKHLMVPKSWIYQPEQVEQWNDFFTNFDKLYRTIIKYFKSETKTQSPIKNYNLIVDVLTRMNLLNHILDSPEINSNFSVKASHGSNSVTKATYQLKNLILGLDYDSSTGENVNTRIGNADSEVEFSELKMTIGLKRLE